MAPFDRSKEDARLKALLAEGLTYGQCAVQLAREGFPSRSRNAHIGRALPRSPLSGSGGMGSNPPDHAYPPSDWDRHP